MKMKILTVGLVAIVMIAMIGTTTATTETVLWSNGEIQITMTIEPMPTIMPMMTIRITPVLPDLVPAFGAGGHCSGEFVSREKGWTHFDYEFGLVKNDGSDCERNFSVALLLTYHRKYNQYGPGKPKLLVKRVCGLSSSETEKIETTITWDEKECLEFAYKIVDIYDEIKESNEENNGEFGVSYLAMLSLGPRSYKASVPQEVQEKITEMIGKNDYTIVH